MCNGERPSTSRHCQKKSPKKSPWRNAGGKLEKFKKIIDDQARRTVKRTVFLMKGNQSIRNLTPKKVSPAKKINTRLINKRQKQLQKVKNKVLANKSSTLEEGELRSYIGNSLTDTIKNVDNDDDDCVVIEPTLEEITIDDNDDDDFRSTSDVSTNYQSLINAFRECESSTPCQQKKSAAVMNGPSVKMGIDNGNTDTTLQFFVDVRRGTESINSTDNFTDYVKLSMLKSKSDQKSLSGSTKPFIAKGSEVIDLDDSSSESMNATLKCKSNDLIDDSVIFVSATNKNDFIPIVDDNIPPNKILKISNPTPKTPANKLCTNSLFTQSETKKLNAYNANAYNPGNSTVYTSPKRMVIIDGSNVAFKHGLDQGFSVKGITIAVEYFEKIGHEVKVVIPQFRMNKSKSTNPEELERLHKAGKLVQTPCKNLPGCTTTSYDDRFILQLAFATDAVVVSNDNFRDLIHENPAFKKIVENRVIGYTWCNDIFIIPIDPYGKWGPTLNTILNRS